MNDYLLWFSKDRTKVKVRQLYVERSEPEDDPKFNTLISPSGEKRRIKNLSSDDLRALLSEGWEWARVNYPIVSQHPHERRGRDFVWNGRTFSCGFNAQWRFDLDEGMPRLAIADRLFDGGGASLGGVIYWKDWPHVAFSNIWGDLHGEQDIIYVVQTNRKILDRCVLMTTDPGDLVLDPTCGSGTTAYVAEQWGRRWITIDTSRVALALARTRLMAARFPYYYLADSCPQMTQMIADEDIKNYLRQSASSADKNSSLIRGRVPLPARHPQGLCVQACSPRHSQVDRQQSRHQGRHDPSRDRRRHSPPRRDRDSLRPALRRQEPHPGERAVHGREPVARPDRRDRRGTARHPS